MVRYSRRPHMPESHASDLDLEEIELLHIEASLDDDDDNDDLEEHEHRRLISLAERNEY